MQLQHFSRQTPSPEDLISPHTLDGHDRFGNHEPLSSSLPFDPDSAEPHRNPTRASADAFLRLPSEVILRYVTPLDCIFDITVVICPAHCVQGPFYSRRKCLCLAFDPQPDLVSTCAEGRTLCPSFIKMSVVCVVE